MTTTYILESYQISATKMQCVHIFAIKMLYLRILATTDLLSIGLSVCLCVCPFLEKRSTIIIFINTCL